MDKMSSSQLFTIVFNLYARLQVTGTKLKPNQNKNSKCEIFLTKVKV